MKKYKIIIISLITMMLSILPLNAASFSMTSSTKNVKPNGTFTINVGGDCIGRVDLKISNGTLSTNSVWVEQGYTSVTVNAGSSGSVTITATPVTGFSDRDANLYNPGSRTITVNISSGSTNTSKPSTPKSSDNNLSELKISGYELTPAFDKTITEYRVDLKSETTKITINAVSSDSKAKIEGLGEKEVHPGNNNFEIIVTAENGEEKIYKINAYVDETPEVYLNFEKEKIGIIRNYEGVEIPEEFRVGEITINNKTIKIFSNDKLNIIYGINEKNEKSYYIIDKEKNEITNKITIININGKTLYIINDNTTDKIMINETEVGCKKLDKKSDYCILKTINNEQKEINYLYETKENGIIKYTEKLNTIENNSASKIITYIMGALLLLSITLNTYLIYKMKKGGTHEKTK